MNSIVLFPGRLPERGIPVGPYFDKTVKFAWNTLTYPKRLFPRNAVVMAQASLDDLSWLVRKVCKKG
jgi:hypothetical protein